MPKLSAKIAVQLHLHLDEQSPREQQRRLEKIMPKLEEFLRHQFPNESSAVCKLLRVSEEPRGPFCVAACLNLNTPVSGSRRPKGSTATRARTLAGWLKTLEEAGVRVNDTSAVSIFSDDMSLDYRITLQQALDTGWRWGTDDEAHWEGLARGILIAMDPDALCARQGLGRKPPEERRAIVESVAARVRNLAQVYRSGETPEATDGRCPLAQSCPQWQEMRLRSESADQEQKENSDVRLDDQLSQTTQQD